MKKSTLFSVALLAAAMPLTGNAQTSGSEVIYDQTPWDNEQVLRLFSTAWDTGRNYPTEAELEAIGMNYIDLEIVRSHTRYRPIVADATKDIVSDINHDRKLWCNFPAGYGKNTGGYPSSQFDQECFSMWNYTNLFGSWNYSFLLAPGCWVDAAHKNGTRIYGGIKFFESWNDNGSEGAFLNFLKTKNSDGTFKYARAFVNAATYFGNDGYNYNSEGTSYQNADWRNFHAEVLSHARNLGLSGFGVGQYTNNASITSESQCQQLYGTSEGKIFDCMLNYSGNQLYYRGVATSLRYAKQVVGHAIDLYQGCLIVGMSNDYWTQMNTESTKEMNICLWGEHDQNRFFQFRVGVDPISIQENYQMVLEKGFSGANRNPLNRPAINNSWGSFQVADASQPQLTNAPGFASMVPERTAINFDLPFETHFSLGNGENYFYKGKVSGGSWYNMSMQDIVPTYRWLVCKKGDMATYANDINVRFTHEDAYMKGSSLKLEGATSAGNDIVLFRTNLTVANGSPKVTIAAKGAAGASGLSVILKKSGASDWVEVPYGEFESSAWQEKTLAISGIAQGDVIEYIGLRVNGTPTGWKAFVGKLKVHDDREAQQALIEANSVIAEVREETNRSLSVKLGWKPDYSGYTTSINDFGMVFNDEINVDHFEIFYKEGADGKVREVGRTDQWATYIPNLPCTPETDAYIGVRSVSVDLLRCSPVVWVKVPHTDNYVTIEDEDPYGKSWMSSIGNAPSADDCKQKIYMEKVTTTGASTNLNYQVSSNPVNVAGNDDQYYLAADHQLVLNQGQQVTITIKGYASTDGSCLKYDFIKGYIDYDGNYSFLDADELLFNAGNLNAGTAAIVTPGLSFTFTVPEDAHIGPSRLRIVGSDAWTPHPGPTGGTVKGYSIDFPVEITGTNPDRGPAETYKDRRDQGEPEEPEYIQGGLMGIDDIYTEGGMASVTVENRVAYFTNTEKAWIYDVNGRCVKYVGDGASSVSLSDVPVGVYVVKLLSNQVIRSHKVVVK